MKQQLIERNQMIRAEYFAMTATGTGKQAAKRVLMGKHHLRSIRSIDNAIQSHEAKINH